MADHEFGNAFERETMYASTKTLFDGPSGAFNFANVTVSGYDVHSNRMDGVAEALKLVVTVDVADGEAARLVHGDDSLCFAEYDGLGAVGHLSDGAETNTA